MRRSLLLAPIAWAFPAKAQLTVPPSLLDSAARLLATLMRASRENAIAQGVMPVPGGVRRMLLGYFGDAILRKVRYASGSAESILIPGLAMSYGHAEAVTLGEVVLFRDDRRARTDAKLWAHELTHVMQYERWGMDEFAARYIQDFNAVEKEARDNADRFDAWRQRAAGP